jgi:hypothetical protein
MHSHDYAKTPEEVVKWVKTMDDAGIEKTIILSGATGSRFDSIYSNMPFTVIVLRYGAVLIL